MESFSRDGLVPDVIDAVPPVQLQVRIVNLFMPKVE